MQIFKTDNGRAKIAFHDHRPDQPDLFTCKAGAGMFEGTELDRLTLTAKEMIDLGNYLLTNGKAKQAKEEAEENRLLAIEASLS